MPPGRSRPGRWPSWVPCSPPPTAAWPRTTRPPPPSWTCWSSSPPRRRGWPPRGSPGRGSAAAPSTWSRPAWRSRRPPGSWSATTPRRAARAAPGSAPPPTAPARPSGAETAGWKGRAPPPGGTVPGVIRHFVLLKLSLLRNGFKLGWQQVVGLVVAALVALPLRPRQLMPGLLAASSVGVTPAATMMVLAGAVAGFAPLGPGLPLVLAAALAQFLLCVVASRAVTTALSTVLRSRRARDLSIVLFSLALLGVGLGGPLLSALLRALSHGEGRILLALARWLPPR